mmetsp:Transcript_6397/g.13838  ORF Transcript_6397/g.13838 Transcript_6397/m.13838 type:complete len:132 (+) Transcript_6397:683-1078(+)
MMAQLAVIRIANGHSASWTFTATLRMFLALWNTLFSLHILLKRTEKVAVNPIDSSHGNAMHAIEQPSASTIPSSIDNGMIKLAIIKHPQQINLKKNGCEAMTTRSLLYTCVQTPQPNAHTMATATNTNPTD